MDDSLSRPWASPSTDLATLLTVGSVRQLCRRAFATIHRAHSNSAATDITDIDVSAVAYTLDLRADTSLNTDPVATFGETKGGDMRDRLLRVLTEQALMPAKELEGLQLVPEPYLVNNLEGSTRL